MTANERKYPVGIQNFEKIRKEGYVYVDKTEQIYKLITKGCPYFLSRPRRFGKSLLVSTLQAVFEGRRELFEEIKLENGTIQPRLFIATTDWKWEKHPVLRFDFSKDLMNIGQLDNLIDDALSNYEQEYGITPNKPDVNLRMSNLVITAHRQTGHQAVVLVDEYDKLMLHHVGDKIQQEAVRARFQNLFSPLKDLDEHLRFIFITGISKFSQMGVFSTLNQLDNISMKANYDAICGITEQEMTEVFAQDIKQLAGNMGITTEEMWSELKATYDGYHFSSGMTDIYNPFSLMSAFKAGEIGNYWFESATPSALIGILKKMPSIELTDIEGNSYPDSMFNLSFDTYDSPLPVLYQSGYLTIKDFKRTNRMNMYRLGFPNAEVRTGFADCLYQAVMPVKGIDNNKAVFLNAYNDFWEAGDLPQFIEAIKTFFSGIPYHLDNHNEHHYHALLYTLLTAFGADVSAEESTALGRSDIVLRMPKAIYILEIKYDQPANTALRQIDAKNYAGKYHLDHRPIIPVALCFSSETRNIVEWKAG